MHTQYLVFLFFKFVTLPRAQANLEISGEDPCLDCNCSTKRTLFNITWSCVSTIIICAWVSVHPNVPPSGHWRALWQRLKTMFWTIIAPELILAWAVRQWFAAWEIRDTVNGDGHKGLLAGLLKKVRQWLGKENALQVSASSSRRWTIAHGHLLAMGGLTIVDPAFEKDNSEDTYGQVLTYERYRELASNPDMNFKLPKITVSEIKDRSKGDFLSKLIAIFQTTWFILQCIARGQQGLALTELELVTLALASLNAVTYMFWWHKPLGLQDPIRIYFKSEAVTTTGGHSNTSNEINDVSANDVVSKVGEVLKDLATDVSDLYRDVCKEGPIVALLVLFVGIPIWLFLMISLVVLIPFPIGIVFLLKIIKTEPVTTVPPDAHGLIAARIILALRKFRHYLTSSISIIIGRWFKVIFDDRSLPGLLFDWHVLLPGLFFLLFFTIIFLLPFFTLLILVSFIFTAIFGIVTTSSMTSGATNVPPFYSPLTKSDRYSRMIVFAVFGVIFGGLHCIGWHFTYPTVLERNLWRGSSLAITVIPFIVAPIDYILENFKLNKGFGPVLRFALDLIMTILLFIYVPARLSLIAQALALLREQPQSAFLAVDWMAYVPHIF